MERHVREDRMIYFGTRQALIAAGVCNPSPFPGDPGDARPQDRRGIRHGTFKTLDPHGRELEISQWRARANDSYRVERKSTELEQAEARKIKREREAQQQAEEENRIRAVMERDEQLDRERYKTAEEFREEQAEMVGVMVSGALHAACSGDYGWRLCDEDREQVLGLKAAMVAAIQGARVVRDGEPERPRLRLVKA